MERILKIFDIRPSELRRTLLLQANLFLLICVLLLIKPVSNSLLLSEFGITFLPYVFIIIALAAFVFTKWFNVMYQKYTLIKLHRFFLYGFVGSLFLFAGLFGFFPSLRYVILFFYVWVALYGLISTSQFWILTNVIFNAREARRIFGIIGSGGIAGGVVGGYLASIVVPFIGNAGITFLAGIFMVATIPIVNILWKENTKQRGNTNVIVNKRKIKIQKVKFLNLLRNRHIILLAVITGLGVLVSKLVDFQFQEIASLKYADADDLTAFFGFWYSTFNLLGFGIQLLLTGKILKYLGVSKAQFVLPSSLFFTSILVLFIPSLWSIVIMKGSEGVLKQSVQRSVNELLILPISPEIRNQSKTFIDVFIDSLATGISGLLLIGILFINFKTGLIISSSIILITLIWIGVSNLMKKEYFKSFKSHFLLATDDLTKDEIQIEDVLNNIFSKSNELNIIELLNKSSEYKFSPIIIKKLLSHSNEEIRMKTLEFHPFLKTQNLLDFIWNLVSREKSISVKVEAYLYLLQFDSKMDNAMIKSLLVSNQKLGDSSFLLACSTFFTSNIVLNRSFEIKKKIEQLAENILKRELSTESLEFQYNVLKAISMGRYVSLYKYLDFYLEGEEKYVKISIKACGFTLSKRYLMKLIHYLKIEEYKHEAKESLLFYDESIMNLSLILFNTREIKTSTFVLLFDVIAELGTQNSAYFLLSFLNHKKYLIKKAAIQALNQMKIKYPKLDFKTDNIFKRVEFEVKTIKKLLAIYKAIYLGLAPETLRDKDRYTSLYKQLLDRIHVIIGKRIINILMTLGLEHDRRDIVDVYNGLVSKNKLRKNYSIEFLDMLVDFRYSKMLLPILEIYFDNKLDVNKFNKLKIKDLSKYEALKYMYKFQDLKVKKIIELFVALPSMEKYSGMITKPIIKILGPYFEKQKNKSNKL